MHNSTKDPRNERSQPKLETTYASTEARIDGRNLKSIRAGGTLRRMPVRTGHRRLPHDGGTITPAGVARDPLGCPNENPMRPRRIPIRLRSRKYGLIADTRFRLHGNLLLVVEGQHEPSASANPC